MQQQRLDKTQSVTPLHGQRGYVTLLAALIVIVVGVSLTASLLLSGGSGAFRASALEQTLEARAYADACAEKGLMEVRDNILFSGSGTLGLTDGSCSYSVTAAGETASTVQSTGYAESAVRKVRVDVTTNIMVTESGTSTEIVDANWEEVSDL